eukprot:COSAG01_NODE_69014_length_262_cov_1.257669_1_plen_41_part_01
MHAEISRGDWDSACMPSSPRIRGPTWALPDDLTGIVGSHAW